MEPGDTRIAIGEVRSDAESACATDPHALDPIEESREHEYPIDSKVRDQHGAVLFKLRPIDDAPWPRPANRIASAQPHAQLEQVACVLLDRKPAADVVT
jgi:hypothetical protein